MHCCPPRLHVSRTNKLQSMRTSCIATLRSSFFRIVRILLWARDISALLRTQFSWSVDACCSILSLFLQALPSLCNCCCSKLSIVPFLGVVVMWITVVVASRTAAVEGGSACRLDALVFLIPRLRAIACVCDKYHTQNANINV